MLFGRIKKQDVNTYPGKAKMPHTDSNMSLYERRAKVSRLLRLVFGTW
jgi:hypothetical protein